MKKYTSMLSKRQSIAANTSYGSRIVPATNNFSLNKNQSTQNISSQDGAQHYTTKSTEKRQFQPISMRTRSKSVDAIPKSHLNDSFCCGNAQVSLNSSNESGKKLDNMTAKSQKYAKKVNASTSEETTDNKSHFSTYDMMKMSLKSVLHKFNPTASKAQLRAITHQVIQTIEETGAQINPKTNRFIRKSEKQEPPQFSGSNQKPDKSKQFSNELKRLSFPSDNTFTPSNSKRVSKPVKFFEFDEPQKRKRRSQSLDSRTYIKRHQSNDSFQCEAKDRWMTNICHEPPVKKTVFEPPNESHASVHGFIKNNAKQTSPEFAESSSSQKPDKPKKLSNELKRLSFSKDSTFTPSDYKRVSKPVKLFEFSEPQKRKRRSQSLDSRTYFKRRQSNDSFHCEAKDILHGPPVKRADFERPNESRAPVTMQQQKVLDQMAFRTLHSPFIVPKKERLDDFDDLWDLNG